MKVSLLEPLNISKEKIIEFSEKLADLDVEFEYFSKIAQSSDELQERVLDSDIAIIANHPFRKEAFSNSKNLKLIAVAFTGLDHVDVKFAKDNGVEVVNAAGYANNSVAELSIGLTLDLFRKISFQDKTIRQAGRGSIGREVKDKTVGIVGTGAIGTRCAELYKAFGANVIGYNRSEKVDFKKIGEYRSWEEVFKKSDIISLHLPLTEETENIVSSKEFSLMKPSSIIINVSRGKVIDTNALYNALKEGSIAGCGLDVFEKEPPLDKDYKLFELENVILSPHIGYFTEEAMDKRADIIFNKVLDFIKSHNN